jgi:hypothetical protein|tara:strand:- start:457 stop:669 length:213 start_codon:yes stop_codon:yes gene_type:complete
MSKVNSINGGYSGGSPRIKSDNPIKPYDGASPKQLNPNNVIDSLKTLYSNGNLSKDSLILIISELNKLVI